TLYAIVVFKLLKGSLFVGLALVAYTLSDNDLPHDFKNLLYHLRINPERKFFVDLTTKIGQLTEANILWAAAGTLLYSLFSFVEGVGLILRISWAGWLAIGESCFFIPIELYELVHRQRHSTPIPLLIILAINIWIVVYLLKNRERLFRH